MAAVNLHPRQHIQNHSAAGEGQLEPHWGYADRVIPCVVDAGSCAYLDSVYHAHDVGMLYTGILYATVGGILLVWAFARYLFPRRRPHESPFLQQQQTSDDDESANGGAAAAVGTGGRPKSAVERLRRAAASTARRYLLPEVPLRWLFGRTTRLQVTVLAILSGYLIIWTFAGIDYRQWVTPVASAPGYFNTRTGLGPFSDRIGVLAYALTPLSVLLATRESLLSAVTGIPYQNFNFLHRWLGYVIVVQSAVHTIGWCVVELRLYQPQPSVGREWIVQLYMVWGVVAMGLLLLMFALSTPWAIRATGYEFFRKAHYVLAMVYVGACWGHWEQLSCFLIPALVLWAVDRGARLVRSALLHYHYLPSTGGLGFRAAKARMQVFPDAAHGDVVRLDFEHPHSLGATGYGGGAVAPWAVGQHFYLCFPASSIWQSHPFTPLSLPDADAPTARHSYVFRAKKGETKRVAEIAAAELQRAGLGLSDPSSSSSASSSVGSDSGNDAKRALASGSAAAAHYPTTPVILAGPYGEHTTAHLTPDVNVLCVAGGTGITYVLPVLLQLVREPGCGPARKVELVWAVRRRADVKWVKQELGVLRKLGKRIGLGVRVFVTREGEKEDEKSEKERVEGIRDGAEVEQQQQQQAQGKGQDCNCAPSPADADRIVQIQPTLPHLSKDEDAADFDPEHRHPDLKALVERFVESTVVGRTAVLASGPGSMLTDMRAVVARLNDGGRVWREGVGDVELTCDDRLEW